MEVSREIVFPVEPDEVWNALTDPDRLEEWFANDVELDPRPGGAGVFRWDNGEERRATVRVAEPGARLVLDWDDEGAVEFTLEQVADGTRLVVVETPPAFTTALELRAFAWQTA
ncbi:MAG: SRPBCC domain-containing protein [Gaiellaceae bacterium]